MPSSNPLSIFYEALNPTTTPADLLTKSSPLEQEPESKSTEQNSNSSCTTTNNTADLDNNSIELEKKSSSKDQFLSSKCASSKIQIDLFPFSIDMDVVRDVLSTIVFTVWGILVATILTFIPRSYRFKSVQDQIILVTGGGSGIGRGVAKKFALKFGATIVIWDINKSGADETVRQIKEGGGKAYSYHVDVSNKTKIYEAADKVLAEVGSVDILINNAGVVSGGKFLETPDEKIMQSFNVNSLALFWSTKKFLPGMIKKERGHIVTIASVAGMMGSNRLVDYCASKFAAVGFHESLETEIRTEMGYDNIHTTLVCPYYINTGMFDGVRPGMLPLLEADEVENDIVAGILSNQAKVIIPRYLWHLRLLKMVMPHEVGQRYMRMLGVTGSMMHFKGRH